jgi:hypothetical protein
MTIRFNSIILNIIVSKLVLCNGGSNKRILNNKGANTLVYSILDALVDF